MEHHLQRLENTMVLTFSARNSGLIAAEDIYFEVEFPTSARANGWKPMEHPPLVFARNSTSSTGTKTDIISYIQTDAPIPQGHSQLKRLPPLLYPGMSVLIEGVKVAIRLDTSPDTTIDARLYARDLPVVARKIRLDEL